MEVLTLEHVNKSFGTTEVIRDLSLSVEEHSIYGFLGKNGAGKTTTMKMILGFLQQDSGTIRVCGEKVSYGNTATNKYIGYLPDVPEFYGFMKPKEYLKLCGEICGMDRALLPSRTEEMLSLVGLDGVNRRIRGFSRGMKQRLGIAQALLNQPKLLICDEPTSALDPVGRKEILDILSLAKERTTIMFSTHILSDVERICDYAGILSEKRLVVQGTVAEIRNQNRKDLIQIELPEGQDMEALAAKIRKLKNSLTVTINTTKLDIEYANSKEYSKSLLALLLREEVPILRYEIMEPSLENVFLEVAGQ